MKSGHFNPVLTTTARPSILDLHPRPQRQPRVWLGTRVPLKRQNRTRTPSRLHRGKYDRGFERLAFLQPTRPRPTDPGFILVDLNSVKALLPGCPCRIQSRPPASQGNSRPIPVSPVDRIRCSQSRARGTGSPAE
jgi:hypothetical protein